MINAYRHPDRTRGHELMVKLINSISHGVPATLDEITTLGRALKKRTDDVLANFDRPAHPTAPPKTSTADLNIPDAAHSDSATSPTT